MKVTIYGRSQGCQFCDTAKQVCETNKFDYDFIDLDEAGIDAVQLSAIVGTPVRKVPQILVDDVYVGGCTEFVNGLREGKFQ